MGDVQTSEQSLKEALTQDPKSFAALMAFAHTCLYKGSGTVVEKLREAEVVAHNALELQPERSTVWALLTILYSSSLLATVY